MIDLIKEKSDSRPIMVSIRCCAYNHEPYIRQCLEGFVMQKTNFRFEAIVHDDASTDGTAAIIREYAERYPDIIKPIFEEENQYSKHDGSLRRIMNAHMHGKYIAWCEGDDYWTDPLKLQKQVDFLEEHSEYGLVFTNYNVLYRGKLFIGSKKEPQYSLFDIYNANPIRTLTILVSHELYRKCHSYLTENKLPSLDLSIFLWFAHNAKIKYLNDITSVYRIQYNSISHSYDINVRRAFHQNVYVVRKKFAKLLSLPFAEEDLYIAFQKTLFKECLLYDDHKCLLEEVAVNLYPYRCRISFALKFLVNYKSMRHIVNTVLVCARKIRTSLC